MVVFGDVDASLVKEAESSLAKLTKEEKKTAQANMAYWMRANNITESKGVRGPQRDMWLAQYMAFMQSKKNAKTSTATSNSYVHEKQKERGFSWWCKATMIKELGETKALAYIASKTLISRPCAVTGQDTEELREYKVFQDGGSEIDKERSEIGLTSTEADLDQRSIQEARATMESVVATTMGEDASFSSDLPVVKIEPKDEEIVNQEALLNIPPAQTLAKYQQIMTEAETFADQAKTNKYAGAVRDDLVALLPVLKKVIKAFQSLCINSDKIPKGAALKMLLKDKSYIDQQWSEARTWALKLGLPCLKKDKGGKRGAKRTLE